MHSLSFLVLSVLPLTLAFRFWSDANEGEGNGALVPKNLHRRQDTTTVALPTVTLPNPTATLGVGTGNISAGVGPISAGVGNVNITIGNITVEAGDVTVENIEIGNVTVLVSVALEAGSVLPTPTNLSLPGATVGGTGGVTVTAPPVTATGTTVTEGPDGNVRRQEATTTTGGSGPVVSGGVGVGDVGVNVAGANVAVGNVSLTVGNILVHLGDVSIKNVTIGNILVAVQLGKPSNQSLFDSKLLDG